MSHHEHEHHHHNAEACAHGHSADVHTEHCGCGCGGEHGDTFESTKKNDLAKLIASAILFSLGRITETLPQIPEYLVAGLFAAAFLILGIKVLGEALRDITQRRFFSENVLMSVVSLGAFAIKEYGEGCAVILLWSLGEYIQGSVLSKSRARIRALSDEHGFEHAHSNSNTERFISKFARVYTPIIFLTALLIIVIPPLFMNGEWKDWAHRGLSALVIGCPCAIVISVPLCFSCAIGACTREGIFVHCSDALETLYKTGNSEEIVIPGDDAKKRDFAVRAAKKAVVLSIENSVLAIGIKLAVLILVIFLQRELPMWLAECSDAGVAVLAIANSLRAMRVK